MKNKTALKKTSGFVYFSFQKEGESISIIVNGGLMKMLILRRVQKWTRKLKEYSHFLDSHEFLLLSIEKKT